LGFAALQRRADFEIRTIRIKPRNNKNIMQITKFIRDTVIQSLTAGLTPRLGLEYIFIGRNIETQTLCADLQRVKNNGSAFRFIQGSVGCGKSTLKEMIKRFAVRDNLVVVEADITVNHRLHGSDGQARALYTELMKNLHESGQTEGGGLRAMVECWINTQLREAGEKADDTAGMRKQISEQLRKLDVYPGGFEFAQAIVKFYDGFVVNDLNLQDNALRWLQGEYATKTEAKQDLGLRRIIGDGDLFNTLKMFAAFCRILGYSGLYVMLDEFGVLTHRLPNSRSRQGSFDVILNMINECATGGACGLGFFIAGVPESVIDQDRGLYSVPALRSRLQQQAVGQYTDRTALVIRIERLAPEEVVMLLEKIRYVHAMGDESCYIVSDDGIRQFLETANQRLGQKFLENPRVIVKAFVGLLNILEQNPSESWSNLMPQAFAPTIQNSRAEPQALQNLNLRNHV
jgi:hypothetical protein